MINIIPQTELRLLKTPLEQDSEHTLSFNNMSAQTSYFLSQTFKAYSDFTYQRESQSVVVSEPYDTICTCNYLMYKNNGFTNKYFYAFISKMEYVSENSTRIYFTIDSLQTWYFNINYNRTFVEREHVNDDSLGANTVPEGLECGELTMCHAPTVYLNNPTDYYICLAVSEDPYESIEAFDTVHRKYNGIFSGLYYIGCKTFNDATNVVAIYDSTGKADAIYSIFMIPKTFITSLLTPQEWKYPTVGTAQYTAEVYLIPDMSNSDIIGGIEGIYPTTIGNNYTPRNKKLLTFPFNYMVLSNNSGGDVVYKYEDFTYDNNSPKPVFSVQGSICPGCSMKAIPFKYKNSTGENYNFGLMLGKLPVCSWSSDVYTNWLTQNGINTEIHGLFGAVGGLAEGVNGNPSGIASGALAIYDAVHAHTVADLIPAQAKGNINAGDINFSYSNNGGLTLYYMSLRNEFASIIDEYFDKFGYKINRVKVPNITGRRNWNYVKTIDCNFTGNLPQEDLDKIKAIFNRGVTFWHNANNFLNYSVNNDII